MNKLIKYFLLSLIAITVGSCQSEDEYSLTEDALYPRIFGTWPEPNTDIGETLGSFSGQTALEFNITMQYTPYDDCEVVWYLDNVEYCRGGTFSYFSWEPITHTIKIVVTTPLYETYREAYLKIVNPL